jgi:hypothetical protein
MSVNQAFNSGRSSGCRGALSTRPSQTSARGLLFGPMIAAVLVETSGGTLNRDQTSDFGRNTSDK